MLDFVRDVFGLLGGVYNNKQDRLVFAFPFIFPVVATNQSNPSKQLKGTNTN